MGLTESKEWLFGVRFFFLHLYSVSFSLSSLSLSLGQLNLYSCAWKMREQHEYAYRVFHENMLLGHRTFTKYSETKNIIFKGAQFYGIFSQTNKNKEREFKQKTKNKKKPTTGA